MTVPFSVLTLFEGRWLTLGEHSLIRDSGFRLVPRD